MANRKLTFISHRFFLYSLYLPLLYFQELVDKYKIHYNRARFGKLHSYLPQYDLHQYRQLYSTDQTESSGPPYTLPEKNPVHIRYVKYFLVVYLIRCILALMGRQLGASRQWRIVLGHEVMGKDGLYIEATFLFWTLICILFFHFTLTNSLLDYKWLSLFSMSDRNCLRVHPRELGLSEKMYLKFKIFRGAAFLYYNLINFSLNPVAISAVVSLFILTKLYVTNTFWSVFYTLIHCYYIFIIIAIIYFNLIAFIVVTYYIHLKQRLLIEQIRIVSQQLTAPFLDTITRVIHVKRLVSCTTQYSHLQDEIRDYNRFWSSYLTFVFVIYVLLVSLIAFICLFAQTAAIINAAYIAVFFFHILSMSLIIYFCGSIVRKNEETSNIVMNALGKSIKRKTPVTFHLKLHILSQNLKITSNSGFCLLNNYLITHDTFRLLITNIILYFLLILSSGE